MKITFIRHAEKEGTGENPSLTKRGIKQTKFLSKRLKKEKFDVFYCSGINRAKQTAEIVSKIIKLKPKVEESLNEFDSETLKKNKNRWNHEEKNHYNELVLFLKKITENPNKEKSILIISHGITNRFIMAYFLELDLKNLIRFKQADTGINSIYWVEKFKNWRLNVWNDDNHIPRYIKD